MKKLHILGFLICMQSIVSASDRDDDFSDFKSEVMPKIKETIFYPKEYDSYEEFRKKCVEIKYVDKLLGVRFQLLADLKKLKQDPNSKFNILRYKDNLDLNEISLKKSASEDTLSYISFNDGYIKDEEILDDQLLNIATILKLHLESKLILEYKNEEIKTYIAKIEEVLQEYSIAELDSNTHKRKRTDSWNPATSLVITKG
jgi:hypothetical protein